MPHMEVLAWGGVAAKEGAASRGGRPGRCSAAAVGDLQAGGATRSGVGIRGMGGWQWPERDEGKLPPAGRSLGALLLSSERQAGFSTPLWGRSSRRSESQVWGLSQRAHSARVKEAILFQKTG